MSTISAVLYANTNHPELKADYPNWNERCKHILKKWRVLTTEQKTPYLQKARDNRSSLRMKKAQQVGGNDAFYSRLHIISMHIQGRNVRHILQINCTHRAVLRMSSFCIFVIWSCRFVGILYTFEWIEFFYTFVSWYLSDQIYII